MCRVHHAKFQAEWLTSWNQDCRGKYQQLQICKWFHPNGRKWKVTKEPLDESERAHLKLNIQKTKLMASGPIPSWQIEGKQVEAGTDFIFLGSRITKMFAPWKESYDKPRQHIKKQRHHFADKGPYSQSYGLSSSHVQMWDLEHTEGWMLKNCSFELWCWRRLLRVP